MSSPGKFRLSSNLSFAGEDANFWYWNLRSTPRGDGLSEYFMMNCRA